MKLDQIGLAPAPSKPAELVPSPTGQIQGFSAQTEQAKEQALAVIRSIPTVSSAEDQAKMVRALQVIVNIRAEVEAGRKRWIEPHLREQQRANAAAKLFDADLAEEEIRGNRLNANFQQLEQAKARSAQIAADLEMSELTRKRHAALAEADTHEAMDLTNMDFDNQAKAVTATVPAPVVAQGQKVKPDWSVEVQDVHALYLAQPTACTPPKPLMGVIKTLLEAGLELPGVKAEKVLVSKVHKSRAGTINV